MLQVGDYAVCPGHGVGQVVELQEKDFGGEKKYFYAIKVVNGGMTVMVPTDSKGGVRALASTKDIEEVYSVLSQQDVEIDTSTWNRRYREYMEKIKTGSLVEIAEVLRALFLLKINKSLSYGEKKMLNHCSDLLAQEISLAGGGESDDVRSKIESYFGDNS